jgi:hypothetical protein
MINKIPNFPYSFLLFLPLLTLAPNPSFSQVTFEGEDRDVILKALERYIEPPAEIKEKFLKQ